MYGLFSAAFCCENSEKLSLEDSKTRSGAKENKKRKMKK
jgi:hypothetical protein